MPIPDLLRDLLEAAGPSGHEEPASRVWRAVASSFAEVHADTLGTSFARVGPGAGAPTLALVGHIDEIGIAITNIGENGLLSFATIGGFSPETLVAQRIRIMTRDGEVRGVVGRRKLGEKQGRGDRPGLEHSDLHIDIGAKDREDAARLVRVGDAAVWDGAPFELPNGRIVSRALDNRLGAYVALEAARRVGEAGDAQVDVVAVAAVGEEVGYFGARTAAFALEPTVAIVIDVTYATDVPGGNAKLTGKFELGSGAAIARGPMINAHVFDLLVAAAEEEEIAHTIEVATRATMTDADQIHISRGGVPTGLISIPLRYMHSPVELGSLDDVEAAIALIASFARRLAPDQSFVR
jgi:putative aminopeptidase FrvX